jgi:hypothetical protein
MTARIDRRGDQVDLRPARAAFEAPDALERAAADNSARGCVSWGATSVHIVQIVIIR